MEPQSPNLEKSRRARNELSHIELAMQGSHHCQHPLVSG
jgi:hypothetical protein